MTASHIVERFDSRASRYDRAYDADAAEGYALRSRMATVVRLLGPGPGAILDAGMGPGRLLNELNRLGWAVHGLDLSPEMVELARRQLPEAGECLRVGSVDALPFADATFDAVVATGVLEYTDPPSALSEFARVLRPGGRCVVSYPNPRAVYAIWKTHCYYATIRRVKRILRRPASTLPSAAAPLTATAFAELLTAVGFSGSRATYTSFLVLPSPLDEVLPKLAAGIGEWAEGRAVAPSRLATQVVFEARRL